MASVKTTKEIDVPVRTAYNQWTQFESFPRFMEGIEKVEQLSDTRVRFTGNVYGVTRTWEADIVEQTPDERIAWMSRAGPKHGGTVLFEAVNPTRTRITLLLEYDPEGVTEKVGDALGLFESRVRGDLDRFREFIEREGHEEGAWRGEIHGNVVR